MGGEGVREGEGEGIREGEGYGEKDGSKKFMHEVAQYYNLSMYIVQIAKLKYLITCQSYDLNVWKKHATQCPCLLSIVEQSVMSVMSY